MRNTHAHTHVLTHISIISLNINDLYYPIKRHRLVDQIKKWEPSTFCFQELHLTMTGRHYLRVEGWKKIFRENEPRKQALTTVRIHDKIHFQPELVRKDKSGYFMLIMGTIHQGDTMILNIYHNPNISAPTCTNITICGATD